MNFSSIMDIGSSVVKALAKGLAPSQERKKPCADCPHRRKWRARMKRKRNE